jgi:hypothetical protein
MSNFTTAGNLAVSQNTTIGGNLNVAGNIIPTGNINMTGNLNVSNLNVNSLTNFNNKMNLIAGSGGIQLNENPIYGSDDSYNFISHVPAVGMQMSGYYGGQLGYTAQTGPYPAPIQPVISWNNNDRVGINVTNPDIISGLHVNGDLKIDYECFLCTNGIATGNVYIGNASATPPSILYINSDIPSTNTTSGSMILTGGAGISGNVNVGGYIKSGGQLIVQSTVVSTNSTTGALIVSGGAGIGGNVVVSSGGNIYANAITASTSTSTGTIQCKGGIGCAGNLWVGGTINGSISTSSAITTTGNITAGNLITGGIISATGNITGGNVNASAHGFNYSIPPTLLSNQLGYVNSQGFTQTNVGVGTYSIIMTSADPPGIYLYNIITTVINGTTAQIFRFGLMNSATVFKPISTISYTLGVNQRWGSTISLVVTQNVSTNQRWGFSCENTLQDVTWCNITSTRIA